MVGSCLIENLLRDNPSIYVLSRKEKVGMLIDERITTVHGDITEKVNLPPGVQTIYHCAGEIYQENQMVKVNVQGTENIVKAALKQGCKLIHLSSAGVVGKHKSKLINESSKCSPQNLYEKTKYEAEKIILRYVDSGLKAKILRPTIIFGVKKSAHADGFLQLLTAIISGKYKNICDGNGIYNIVHVHEVARAMQILESDNIQNGQVFFINTPITFKELSRIVTIEIYGKERNSQNIPFPLALSAAVFFSFISLLARKQIALTLPRLHILTNQHLFSQKLLEGVTHYQPLKSVEEYIREVCREYLKRGLMN